MVAEIIEEFEKWKLDKKIEMKLLFYFEYLSKSTLVYYIFFCFTLIKYNLIWFLKLKACFAMLIIKPYQIKYSIELNIYRIDNMLTNKIYKIYLLNNL